MSSVWHPNLACTNTQAMRLKYRNTPEDHAAHWNLLHPNAASQSAQSHYSSWITFWLLLALAAYLSFQSGQLFFSILFGTYLAYSVSRNVPYSRLHRAYIDRWANSQPAKEITLEIDESGLRETIGEIVSVVPWTAVKAYSHVEKRVFIELTEGLWAIIPQNSVTQDSDRMEDLLSRLKEHGITNKTAEIALRHAP